MTAYDSLLELQKELKIWDTVSSVSFWDQLTVMPKDASPYRAEQNACLAKTKHRLQTSNEYEEQLFKAWTEVQASEGHSDRYIQVKRLKEEFERNRKLSTDLVSRLAKASVQGSAAWEEAKEAGDSSIFLRELETLVDLAKEKADAYGFSDHPYDGLIGDFEQGMNTEDFDKLYTPLKDQLADLVKEANEDQGYRQLEGRFDLNIQDRLGKSLAEDLGFSFANGAIMTSSHPFSITMGQNDFRITTKYLEEDPFSAFYSTAHEVGHSLYERGLKKEYFGTPLGSSSTSGIHESQSLFWENRVCRSPEFLDNWHSKFQESFPSMADWTRDELKKTVNLAKPGYIRVEADETTYCLHIIIRFEIEKLLFSGSLKTNEVEEAWNESYKKYLGLDVTDPRLGCLQDVHWSEGLFGYFPSYALGHILSAQFSESMEKDLGSLDDRIAAQDYKSILMWLKGKIHHQGQRFYAKDLIKDISGSPLSSKPFVDYLKRKRSRIQG